MRIALVNSNRALVGGAETYLDMAFAALTTAGHEVALWCEIDAPAGAPQISLPDRAPAWCASESGLASAFAALRAWCPEVIYVHAVSEPRIEERIIDTAPAVLFDHGYYGTCISGNKMFAAPHPRPCARSFGWPCLFHYYPYRCGGLNPVRMWTEYRHQGARLGLMRRYAEVLVASDHMRDELLHHRFAPERVHVVRLPMALGPRGDATVSAPLSGIDVHRALRLLFVGRMTQLKGGPTMLDALTPAAAALNRPLEVTFVGDGPDRSQWEDRAHRVNDPVADVRINFTGWLGSMQLGRLMRESDLLVVPSTWPEPFGLVGPEAGSFGLPAAAFAVGGIPEWLTNGVNGHLAPGDPPTAAGLAQAIVACLHDPGEHSRLQRGALELARRFRLDTHVDTLVSIFGQAASRNGSASARDARK
jgi:glycosyltransferase involved in cell wall biosynthesis